MVRRTMDQARRARKEGRKAYRTAINDAKGSLMEKAAKDAMSIFTPGEPLKRAYLVQLLTTGQYGYSEEVAKEAVGLLVGRGKLQRCDQIYLMRTEDVKNTHGI